MTSFQSDVVLGDTYEDTITGVVGKATSVHFYLHACERVNLEYAHDGDVKFETFDAPRLTHVSTGPVEQPETLSATRTGGPGGPGEQRPRAPR